MEPMGYVTSIGAAILCAACMAPTPRGWECLRALAALGAVIIAYLSGRAGF